MESNKIPTRQEWDNAIYSFWHDGNTKKLRDINLEELKKTINAISDFCYVVDEGDKKELEDTIFEAIQQLEKCDTNHTDYIQNDLKNILDFLKKIYEGKEHHFIRISYVPYAIKIEKYTNASILLKEGIIDLVHMTEDKDENSLISAYLSHHGDKYNFEFPQKKVRIETQEKILTAIDILSYSSGIKKVYSKLVRAVRNNRSHGILPKYARKFKVYQRKNYTKDTLKSLYKEAIGLIPPHNNIDLCKYTAHIGYNFASSNITNNNTHSCDGRVNDEKQNMETLTSEKIMTTKNKTQFENYITINVCGLTINNQVIIETPSILDHQITLPFMTVELFQGCSVKGPGTYNGFIVENENRTEYETQTVSYSLDPFESDTRTITKKYNQSKYLLFVVPEEKQEDVLQDNTESSVVTE